MAENTDLNQNLQEVIKNAKFEDNLAKGLHEVCKALESKDTPKLCLLAKDCGEKKYKDIITGLCKEKKVPLHEVDSKTTLGVWVGLCKYDAEQNPRKVRGCSSVVIRNYSNNDDAAKNIIDQHIKA